MRGILPELVALVALMALSGLALLLYGVMERTTRNASTTLTVRKWWNARQATRRDRAMSAAPWAHYCRADPVTGNYLIGIERTWGDHVIQRVELAQVLHDDISARLNWEAVAILRAQECNDTRSGMGGPLEN